MMSDESWPNMHKGVYSLMSSKYGSNVTRVCDSHFSLAVCIYNFPLRWTKQNASGDMPSKVYILCWLRLCWMAEYISEMVLFAQSNILSIASAAGDIMETSAATNNIFFISLSFVCRAYIINHKY